MDNPRIRRSLKALVALGALAVVVPPAQAVTYKYTKDFADLQPYESESWTSDNRDYVQQNQAELELQQSIAVGFTDISALVGTGEDDGGLQPYADGVVLGPQQQSTTIQSTALVIEDYSSLEGDSDVPPTAAE